MYAIFRVTRIRAFRYATTLLAGGGGMATGAWYYVHRSETTTVILGLVVSVMLVLRSLLADFDE